MSNASPFKTRALKASDLDRVVEIDQKIVGRSRKGFFEKRVEASIATPEDFVVVGLTAGSDLVGYAISRIDRGGMRNVEPIGVLDAIGIDPDRQAKGGGRQMLAEIDKVLAKKKIKRLITQSDWRFHGLLSFLDAAGFIEAPQVVLEWNANKEPLAYNFWEGENDGYESDESEPDNSAEIDEDEFEDEDAKRPYIPVRSLQAADIDEIVRLDRRITGADRSDYYKTKMKEVLEESGIRVSLVAEVDEFIAGFLMARVDFGEFGRAEPAAVLDTIDVDPRYRGHGVGTALVSQLLTNLKGLRVETARTAVMWNDFPLVAFLAANGFEPGQRMMFGRDVPA